MKRVGCDIYGYPVYEPKERAYTVGSLDGSLCLVVTARDGREAGQKFVDVLSLAMGDGVFIRKVQ